MLRAIDLLQLTAKHKVATLPANWTDGQDVIIGSVSPTTSAKELFPTAGRSSRICGWCLSRG
ncbi:MAG: hypothetical protein R2715_04485 [Ilumatobacteraceae bacterium]